MRLARPKQTGLLIVSLVFTLVMFLPTQAFAHAGHGHAQAVTVHSNPTVQTVISKDSRTGASAHQISQQRPLQKLATSVSASSGLVKDACSNGCCQAGAGPSCCPICTNDASVELEPPLSAKLFPPLARRGAGVTPGALSKPPKSLI